VQDADLADTQGNKIRINVWQHPDLKPLENTEVVVHCSDTNSRYPSVAVRHSSYVSKQGPRAGQTVSTVELQVTKNGQFQHLQVFHQQNGTKPTETQPAQSVTEATKPAGVYPRNGQQVGMALNNATTLILEHLAMNYAQETYAEQLARDLARISSVYLRVSDWLEKGNLVHKEPTGPLEKKVDEEAKRLAEEAAKRKADEERLQNKSTEKLDEDVPY